MPYPKPFVRISWLFTVQGTEEVAETGLHISTLGTAPFDAVAFVNSLTQANGLALAGYMTTMLNGATNALGWATYSNIVAVKAADQDVTGHETVAPFAWNSPTPYDHGSVTNTLPQSTVVLSLRSGGTFGRANFGRMYLPHTVMALSGSTPRAAATTTTQVVNLARTFCGSVNALVATKLAGSGIVNISQVGAGTVKPVTLVEVGDITDTQRRRRNRIPEIYSSVAL